MSTIYIMPSDPILYEQTENSRLSLFPLSHPEIYELYQKQLDCFWRPQEVQLGQRDLSDWERLSEDEKGFILRVFGFFANADGVVLENLCLKFCSEVKLPESRAFFAVQMAMEQVHSETYAILIDTFAGKDKDKLFAAIQHYPCIRKKNEWALKHISDRPFALRLIAFSIVEGLFFSGSFCAIFWLKKRGLMPGVCLSNEFISRDEALHCEHAHALYHALSHDEKRKVSWEDIKDLVLEAVDIEKEFICDSLSCRLIGMNANLMCQYIEFCADRIMLQLGFSKLFHCSNPFPFMELISLDSKANFFEKKVHEYSLANKMVTDDCFDCI